MSTEPEFTEALRLLAAGLGMTDAEDTPYLRQIHDRLEEIKQLQQQSHEASEAIRAEAQAVLDAHAESAQDYLKQVDEPEPTDFHPFLSAPEGTTVRDLPDGGRLFTLIDAAMVRASPEDGLTFIGDDGAAVPLEPARGGIVRLPDGRTLTLKPEAVRVTHEAAGIEGLPLDIEPVEVAAGRYRVELPSGTRLDVSHQDRAVVLGNTDGTVGGRRGDRSVEPVADELAELDDVLALPGRGQKGLRGLRVQVVGQHVADAAEELEQHDAQVGGVEIRPAVRQLRHLAEQLAAQGVVVLVRVGDACSTHLR